MKMNKQYFGRWAGLLGAALLVMSPIGVTSCTEEISEDAFAVKSMNTMMDCINETDSLSQIKALFDEVRLGRSSNASVLSSVLAARGNYTVFAPGNDAIRRYVESVTNGEASSIDALTMEQKEQIALNCVIDNGTSNAYEIADFPSDGGTFTTSTLKDRRLACEQKVDNNNIAYYEINGNAKVVISNIEVSYGMLHVVDHVIAPSTNSVAELIQSAGNMRIMGKLLTLTGYADSLSVKTEEEQDFETAHMLYAGSTRRYVGFDFPYMATRSVGYTAFIEPDEVFNTEWGVPTPNYDENTEQITNWDDEVFPAFLEGLKGALGVSEIRADYTNPSNPLNQFVAYHLLDGAMSTDEFVHHHNEYDYDYGTDLKNTNHPNAYSVNVWDYFTTKGSPRGLMKITQCPNQDFYINRISKYNDGFDGDYKELSFEPNANSNGLNVKVSTLNGEYDNNALNGFYFPIDHVLVYGPEAKKQLGGERIRIDMTTMLPELVSNDLRGRSARYFPNGYFKNISNESQGTQIYLLQDGYVASNGSWKDYQGDEFLVSGRFDLVLQLPPVPVEGQYEIRMGASLNQWRCMVQVYFGESPYSTKPCGLPIDERESVSLIPGQPWVEDTGDEATDRENDRNLRNQNYMKAPNYFCVDGTKGKETCRNASPSSPALRRILTSEYMYPNKTYYLRFKSAIESDVTQLMLDYFEFVPKKIYNGETPEDIW